MLAGLPTIYSTSNNLLIRFVTDGDTVYSGWSVQWNSKCWTNVYLLHPTYIITTAIIAANYCMGVQDMVGSSGSFQDHTNGGYYRR